MHPPLPLDTRGIFSMEPAAVIEIRFLDNEPIRFPLAEHSYFIGRGDRCHIRFSGDTNQGRSELLRLPADRYQSAIHCTLMLMLGDGPAYYRIKDGEVGQYASGKIKEGRLSTNGVFVNGDRLDMKVSYRRSLKHGDYIRLSPLSGFTYLSQKEERQDIRDTLTAP